jgi:hypothetical protein
VIPERDGHLGSKAPLGQSAGHFQSTPIIGRLRCRPPLRKRANCGPSFHSGPVDSGVAFKRAGPAMAPDVMAFFEPTMEGSMSKRTPTRRILRAHAEISESLSSRSGRHCATRFPRPLKILQYHSVIRAAPSPAIPDMTARQETID